MHYERSVTLLMDYSLGVIMTIQSVHCIVCCRIELRKEGHFFIAWKDW